MKENYRDEKWIGRRFGMLVVEGAVHIVQNNGNKQWYWKMKCDCGNHAVLKPYDVIKGSTISCGCYRKTREPVGIRHGKSHSKLHNTWCGMNYRCKHHRMYAGRGIKVCDDWKIYENFEKWAYENGFDENKTIERIDVNGDYCPENCKWIPLEEQARNRTTTRWVGYNGEMISLAEAAEKAGLPYKQVFQRIEKYGWTVDRALSTPMKGKSELHKKCDELGLNYHIVYNRIHVYGWSEEEALKIPNLGTGSNQETYKEYK